ncbi:MAG: formylglycine-generating enzyme family protein [Planctomycetaceae bacterium]|jgi:formylglycine-generating enzyme required for sulfatase activity|nr:formylglycine-generating enzyme family protein [Planctomycetaceae bacterium]
MSKNKFCLYCGLTGIVLCSAVFTMISANDSQKSAADDKHPAQQTTLPPAKISNIPSGNRAGERITLTVNNMEYAFHWCPAGTFTMGSPESETDRWGGETQHRVTLTKGFWMQETEVTQEQWENVKGSNPSHFKGNRLPVENVSWDDCQYYLRKLNALISSDYEFSLPTEAQWEYACRAGSTTAYSFGDSREQLKDYAWFGAYLTEYGLTASSGKTTNPVGQKKANAWGLYDMHGNVWEWCNDLWWHDDYPSGSATDPIGANNGSFRVGRGGSWNYYALGCRSAFRTRIAPARREYDWGLRLSLVDKSK